MFDQLISKIQPGDLIPVLAILFGCTTGAVIAVTAIIVGNLRRFKERQGTLSLIDQLVERGFTAQEIERLVQVSLTPVPEGGENDTAELVRARMPRKS
jgi:hypothetical protein